MNDSFWQKFIIKIGVAIFVVALADLAYINYWVLKNQDKVSYPQPAEDRSASLTPPSPSPSPYGTPSPSPTKSSAPEATPTTVVEKNTVVSQQTVVQTAQKEIFVPVGEGLTKSQKYVDLSGAQVTLDSSKYSGISSVVFEANLWVTDGNGKMYAQLYNSTAKRPVWFSEISTSSATGTLIVSAPITLDPGANTYILQAKTDLEQFPANVRSARIKITLK